MENKSDPPAQYQELMKTSFDKINKQLPKKYKQIKTMLTSFIGNPTHFAL